MHTINLRKVVGSVMLAVPPPLLDLLHLRPGAKVHLTVEKGRLVIEAQKRPRYTLKKLLAECNAEAALSRDDRAWVTDSPAGGELL
jgi:antitoxin ChpS